MSDWKNIFILFLSHLVSKEFDQHDAQSVCKQTRVAEQTSGWA